MTETREPRPLVGDPNDGEAPAVSARRRWLRTAALAPLLALAPAAVVRAQGARPRAGAPASAARAAGATIAVLSRADDERREPRRAALAYLGQPTGPLRQGVDVALDESRFELEAAGVKLAVVASEVRSEAEAREQAARLVREGASAIVTDLPTAWTLAAAAAAPTVLNAGNADDALRGPDCRATLLHTLPSERMRADALAQTLTARRWAKVLLLHGPSADDARRTAVVEASMKRFGLRSVGKKPFKLSADPRERDLHNPLLLTGGVDHDAVWVVDSDGEFARGLPYRTALPRPVVGDAGLVADAWAPAFERYGAPQLARRFQKAAGRGMTGVDWAAWIAAKAVVQAALAGRAPTPATMTAEDFLLDGFKGVRLSFRRWDRQLRQPLLLTDGQGVVALAPVEGVLHPRNVLDTLGADAPESLCKVAS